MTRTLSASEASALAATAADWLVAAGLQGLDLCGLVDGLSLLLAAAGVALDRVGCSILTLHPQIVSQEATWRADTSGTVNRYYTPQQMEDPENRYGPYFELALSRIAYKRYRLDEPGVAEGGALLTRLRNEGYTEYLGFFHPTGGGSALSPFARRVGLVPCVVGSFATRRPGGFSDVETDCLGSISRTLALAAKARATFETGARLLDIYLGRVSGHRVLDGHVTRGDSERISCGILFCDLRRSSQLVTQLPLDDYVGLLNRYFEVTVGAVMAEGGEVLKFIGDAIMGIFPSDSTATDVEMRGRALDASTRILREIHALDALNEPLEVGLGLHVGEVMYGNVGTNERLDFTVIGRAVNEAARLQELTKKLGQPVLASSAFVAPIRDRFDFAGAHPVAGFSERLEIYSPRTR